MKGTREWVKEEGFAISPAAESAIESIELTKRDKT